VVQRPALGVVSLFLSKGLLNPDFVEDWKRTTILPH
jgi:hypothetical protein